MGERRAVGERDAPGAVVVRAGGPVAAVDGAQVGGQEASHGSIGGGVARVLEALATPERDRASQHARGEGSLAGHRSSAMGPHGT